MKLHRVVSNLILWLAIILIGCTPGTTETPTVQADPTATATVIAANIETATNVPTEAPSMQVGSTYYYVDGTTLVAVPAGEFSMGAGGQDNPTHSVSLNDFWIYSTKVTNTQYALCVELGKCTSPNLDDNPNYAEKNRANDPIVGVTYDQAAAYCNYVQGRLPTEAEWEKAARNPDGSLYPWGDAAPSCDLINFNNCVGASTNVIDYSSGKSFYGGLDFLGNVFEWVSDWYDADYYANSSDENPQGPSTGSARSVRSSSFSSTADQISISSRGSEDPLHHRPDLGFRCVVENPTHFAPFCEAPLIYGSQVNAATQSAEACPALEIKQAPYCAGKQPMTNIQFNGPSDAIIDASNCISSQDPTLFTCQSPGTIVSISASCQANVNGNALCPDGFSQQGDQCIADGSGGECLDGNYDSNGQCCMNSNSSTLISSLTICPAGTFYSESENACLDYPAQELITVTQDVLFTACSSVIDGGNDDNDSCAPQSCGLDEDWVPDLCCCAFFYDHTQCVP